jgi:Late exocytosis, associated with Golgi transport/Cytosolic domain of 10TM putative phosphate transporter
MEDDYVAGGFYEGTVSPLGDDAYLNSTISSSNQWYLWGNIIKASNDTDLEKASDVSVDAVVTSIYFNSVVFILLMVFYECLRRTIPSVYSSRKRMCHMQAAASINQRDDTGDNTDEDDEEATSVHPVVSYFSPIPDSLSHNLRTEQPSFDEGRRTDDNLTTPSKHVTKGTPTTTAGAYLFRAAMSEMKGDNYKSITMLKNEHLHRLDSKSSLPDSRPLDWIQPVLGVPWSKVLETAGLDGYFFLRYIRMCVRITAVSSFWFFLILVPAYVTGSTSTYSKVGWYHISVENIPATGWRMWIACIFLYLFSFFIFFVVKQEYRHFLEVRQDFLAKGSAHVHPQHHYSLLVESIPYEIRSDRALEEYFNRLFPGKVHSASVVLKLPDLERTSARCLRSCRRLEKSIAMFNATGRRSTHVVGRARMNLLGIEFLPMDCSFKYGDDLGDDDSVGSYDDDDGVTKNHAIELLNGKLKSLFSERPKKGTRVDSIQYYTQELAMHSRALYRMQERKIVIAEDGNDPSRTEDTWFDIAIKEAAVIANQILDDSAVDNDLKTSSDQQSLISSSGIAENMTSRYGSISHGTILDYNSQSKCNVVDSTSDQISKSGIPNAKGSIDPLSSSELDRRKRLIDSGVSHCIELT